MGKIIELIKKFINPIEPEKSFEQLAVESGIGPNDLAVLKKSMGGISWEFDEGADIKGKQPLTHEKSSSKKIQIKAELRAPAIEKNDGFGRDD